MLPVRVQSQCASIGSRTVQRETAGADYAFPMAACIDWLTSKGLVRGSAEKKHSFTDLLH